MCHNCIPQTAHLIWFGQPPAQWLLDCVGTFTTHHPGWETRWWGEADIDTFRLTNHDVYATAADLVPADSVYQLQSDIVRYEILHRYGGLYIDLDYWWQKPIDPVIHGHAAVTAWEQQDTYINNGLIATVPGHPALAAAIDAIPTRLASRQSGMRANQLTGPHLWTPIAQEHGVMIVDQALFHPVPWTQPELASDVAYPDAVAIHMWNHQRTLKGMDG